MPEEMGKSPPQKEKEPSKRLSKVNREASNRGRNHSVNPANWTTGRLPERV
jgi:hypothetical protein